MANFYNSDLDFDISEDSCFKDSTQTFQYVNTDALLEQLVADVLNNKTVKELPDFDSLINPIQPQALYVHNICGDNFPNSELPSIDSLKEEVLQVNPIKPTADINVHNICGDNFPNILKTMSLTADQRKLVKSLYTNQYKRYVIPIVWLKTLEENDLANKDGNIRLVSYIYTKIKNNSFEFTNIESKKIKSFSRDYKKVIDVLAGLSNSTNKLYVNNIYSTGIVEQVNSFTKSYRCFKSNDTEVVYLTISDTFTKPTADINVHNICGDNFPKSTYLETQQKMFEDVQIDIKSALEHINPQRKDFKSTQRAIKVLEIYKGNLYITQPDNNRIYHSFNGLDSDLRQFLKTKNSTFKTLDIVAAQPSILMTLIDNPSEDTKKLIEIFKTNRIYNYLANELNESVESIKLKYMIFTFKFDSNNKILKYYLENFPGFINDLNTIRSDYKVKDFWNLLANKETQIMAEVFNQVPGTKITIHDEIMIEEQYFELAKQTFNNILCKYNVPSKLK